MLLKYQLVVILSIMIRKAMIGCILILLSQENLCFTHDTNFRTYTGKSRGAGMHLLPSIFTCTLHVRNSNVRTGLIKLSPSVSHSSLPQPPQGSCPSSPLWRLLRTWCLWLLEWSSFQTSGWIFLLNRCVCFGDHSS